MNKKLLAVAVSSALALPMAAQAVKFKLSGQVNRAMVFLDDDVASDIHHIDNGASGTRWIMSGSEDIGNGMKVGFNWEWQNSSNLQFSRAIKDGDGPDSQAMRKAEVWFSGNWGKLSIGQGDGAGNGTTEVDLSDTWNAGAYVSRVSFGSGVAWRTGAGQEITAGGATVAPGGGGLRHGQTGSYFDAFSRFDRVRYDSPALGPVTISASVGQNEVWDIAGRVSTSLGGGQLSGAIFYGETSGIDNRWGGSASFLFSQGTNITFSYSQNDPGGATTEADSIYIKLGHKWGNNAVSVGYGVTDDQTVGFEDSGWNIGFNHNIPKPKVDIYASYHHNELDTPTGVPGVGDISAFVVGTKLKFD
jgi:predicted porin